MIGYIIILKDNYILPGLLSIGAVARRPLIRVRSLSSDFTSILTSFVLLKELKSGDIGYSCLATLEDTLVVDGCWTGGASFGGVISFIVSFDLRNSSSSSVPHAELIGAVPYLSSVVILKRLFITK